METTERLAIWIQQSFDKAVLFEKYSDTLNI